MNPVVHFEMPSEDRKRLIKFYTSAFGWKMQETGPEMGNYVVAHTTETDANNMVKTPGAINGGFGHEQLLGHSLSHKGLFHQDPLTR